jgi:trans-4-hydroxy-L-proline dehydratase
MNERIRLLRQQSIDARPAISAERALLITQFYKKGTYAAEPVVIQRARAFEHIMLYKEIFIGNEELIVGERGPAPKATPTYPEICLHSPADLEIIHSRPKVSFHVDNETLKAYCDEIIPFWQGISQRDRLFSVVSESWKNAYDAGIFTEFQEQRAPGHTVAGKKVFTKGMNQIIGEIAESQKVIQQGDHPLAVKQEMLAQLEAMRISAAVITSFAARYAMELKLRAEGEKDKNRQQELLEMARICHTVPAHAPQTFHEALQHYWFIHLGVITELNPWDSFCPGRLDQHLNPFYKKELQEGTLTQERATELLQAFWIKFNNHPSPPKMGVTAKESNTYTDFSLINLGGLKEDGSDGVNELTFLILDVIEEMRLLQPSSMVQVSKKSPDAFVKRALKISKTGFGQPSFFNTDAIIQQLLSQGKVLEDARNGGASGCVETGAFGTEAYTLSGYFNLNKVLEITLFKGFDPVSQVMAGIDMTLRPDPASFDELYQMFEEQLQHFIHIKIEGNNIIEALYAQHLPVPFLSLLTEGCVQNTRDYNAGGARYNTSYIQGVGLGSIADNLASLKKWVFDDKELTLQQFRHVLNNNFTGHEILRHRIIYETPHWGNNDDQADQHAVSVFNSFYHSVTGRPTWRGGVFRINLLPTTCHVYFGEKTGAMPDGRLAGQPLSEGISPVQGADTHGPVAVLQSAAKIDHIRTGGTLLNQKFTPGFFKNDEAIDKLCALVRTWFRMDGHHIQFNVVDAQTLRDARKNPEKYRDLIVRVAGYSDYFNDLGESLQEEIIRRTEHQTT